MTPNFKKSVQQIVSTLKALKSKSSDSVSESERLNEIKALVKNAYFYVNQIKPATQLYSFWNKPANDTVSTKHISYELGLTLAELRNKVNSLESDAKQQPELWPRCHDLKTNTDTFIDFVHGLLPKQPLSSASSEQQAPAYYSSPALTMR